MKKKTFVTAFILMIILSTLMAGCTSELKSEPYNLIVTNNSKVGLRSIGVKQEGHSGGAINADNSLIQNDEEFNMYIESNKFTLSAVDEDGNEYTSSEFNIDFTANRKKVYRISIQKNDSLGALEFILNE